MRSIFEEIEKIRNNKPYTIDYVNRYTVVLNETDGTKTAYYFCVPVCNPITSELTALKFNCSNSGIEYMGTNTDLTIGETAVFECGEHWFQTTLPSKIKYKTENTLFCENGEIFPTLNGLAFKVKCRKEEEYSLKLTANRPFLDKVANKKSFSLMESQFKPYITISCIGAMDKSGAVIAPCELDFCKLNDMEYLLSFIHRDIKAEYIFYEINMHEEKLFQDTTVESSNPKDNNAFGGTAFLGHTDMFGEQWLYSRAEISALSELFEKHIIEATLHIPELSNLGAPLSANRVSARFCSFGSNWNNKITASAKMSDIKLDNGYYSIDVSDLMINKINDRLIKSEGLIIKRKAGNTGFSVVSTGDSFYAPQILEIKFK